MAERNSDDRKPRAAREGGSQRAGRERSGNGESSSAKPEARRGAGKPPPAPPSRTTKKTLGRRAAGEKGRPAPDRANSSADRQGSAEGRRGAQPRDEARSAGSFEGPDWDELAGKAAERFDAVSARAGEAAQKAGEVAKKVAIDLGEGFDKGFARLRTEASHIAKKGQHTRVRIKFRGKELAELPVAIVAAAEVASLWWAGPLRLLLAHFVGKAVLEVEFVSDAQSHVAAGRAFLANGDLDDALKEFDLALVMDRKNAGAHLGRGIAFKLRGDKATARTAFLLAEQSDPHGEAGREARRHLDNLGGA